MPYNLPTYTTTNISFGPAVVFIGPAGTTPETEIGAVRSGASIAITRTVTDVTQGNPPLLVERFASGEAVEITFTAIEWNLDNFVRVLGAGSTTDGVLKFGGTVGFSDLALLFKHRTPAGDTYEIRIWKAKPAGTFTIPFSDDIHEFEMTFNAQYAETDWAGNTLSAGEQLLQIEKS